MSFLDNLYNRLFWSPKRGVPYYNKQDLKPADPYHVVGAIIEVYFVGKEDRKYLCSFKVQEEGVEVRIKSEAKSLSWRLEWAAQAESRIGRSGNKVIGPEPEVGRVREARFYDVSELEFKKEERPIKDPHWEQGVAALDINNITYLVREKEDARPESISMEEMSKGEKLSRLFDFSSIDLKRGKIFSEDPGPLPESFDFDKVEGMMLGLAVADSLGNTTEGMLPEERRNRYGEITDYLPNRHADNRKIGLPSDETQLAFWSIEQMLDDDGEFIPDHQAQKFCSGRLFGLGGTIRGFIRNYKDKGKSWFEAGKKSAGNGALMRIQPILLPHLRNPSPQLWIDTALSAMITHNDSASISACLSFVNILWQVLGMSSPPRPGWWLDTYVNTTRDLEIDDSYKPRGGPYRGEYQGPIWRFVEEKVAKAYQRDRSVVEACDSWYSGAYLLETVPSVIYILMKHGDDPEEAVIRAVNDTKDSDTIGAIVGSVVGALHGKKKIPDRWISDLSGRTRKDDDGRIFELLEEAERVWWSD